MNNFLLREPIIVHSFHRTVTILYQRTDVTGTVKLSAYLTEFSAYNFFVAELHIFSRGGHGYGLRKPENAVSQWPKLCEQWLRAQGYITR